MKHAINTEIALTHITSRKRQILVASLGVTIGVAMYIFMNSMFKGFNRYSEDSLFKTVPHIRVYKEDEISKPLLAAYPDSFMLVVVNPKVVTLTRNLHNPEQLIGLLKRQSDVIATAPEVTANILYNNGSSEINGVASGVNIVEENAMFNIQSSMVDGTLESLQADQDGIIIGEGISRNLSIGVGENISLASAEGVVKILKVTGIFRTGNTNTDKTKSYVNLSVAQQLLKQGPGYITDIYVNVKDPQQAKQYVPLFESLTGYKAEDWGTANASAKASSAIRGIMGLAISLSILLVAGFGIYNILNMTITQKLNDIAILKATGFSGKDVTGIFIREAMIMGGIGTGIGLLIAIILVRLISRAYIGGDIGYFPIKPELRIFSQGMLLALATTFVAGYIPSRKAAKVDPVEIFRK